MDKSEIKKLNLNDSGFLLFVDSDEKTIYGASGFINDTTIGKLVLTDKKLFFFFVSNISRDKIFIASHPYIVSVSLREGLTSSTLVINNKKEGFSIKKLNKNEAKTFYGLLNDIIEKNKQHYISINNLFYLAISSAISIPMPFSRNLSHTAFLPKSLASSLESKNISILFPFIFPPRSSAMKTPTSFISTAVPKGIILGSTAIMPSTATLPVAVMTAVPWRVSFLLYPVAIK